MGIINTVTELFKDSVKPKLDWRESADGVSNLFSKKRAQAAVAIDVDDQEFFHRYKNVKFSSFSSLFFMGISFVSIPMAGSMLGLFTSILAVILFFLFYFRYAFIMWICRDRWGKGEDLESRVSRTTGQYISALFDDPAELLPRALPEKGSKK
jgi:hypothetical protein